MDCCVGQADAKESGDACGVAAALMLALAAGALRWLVWTRTAVIHNDGPTFLGLAQLMGEGEWRAALAHAFHPLYPISVLAAQRALEVIGLAEGAAGWERAGALVSVCSGAASVLAAYALLRWTLGGRLALAGAAVLAVHPYAVSYSSDVQSDGLYLALFLASAACGWRALRDSDLRFALATGVGSALAYLTRPEGIGVAGMLAFLLCVRALRAPLRRAGLATALALSVPALLVSAPYLLHLRESSGHWALTRKKSVLELAGSPPARATILVSASEPLLRERPFLETVLSGPRHGAAGPAEAPAPASGVQRHAAALRVLALCLISGLRPELAVLALVGAWQRGRRAPELGYLAGLGLLYGVACYGMAYGVGYLDRRHVLPLALLSLGFVSSALPLLGSALLRVFARGGALAPSSSLRPWAPAAAGVALVALVALPKTLESRRGDALAERRAAEWLALQPGEIGPVAATRQRVAYYAGASFVPLPEFDLRAVQNPARSALDYLRSAGARHVVVDDRWLGEGTALSDPEPLGLRWLYRAEVGGTRASVFAIEAGTGG